MSFKCGYLYFSHLTEFKNIYITENYVKKQYKSSIIKNHKIKEKKIDGVPIKDFVVSLVIFRFCARNEKKHCGKIKRLMTFIFRNIKNM